ncbi:MAG: hypothetical protein LBP80_05515 [Treponema sp.]|nr:hypothetical protein [Treponema sp.]
MRVIIFTYEDALVGFDAYFLLTKINARTGEIVWRTEPFPTIELCAPQIIGGCVYAFIESSLIYCFDKNSGALAAIVELDAAGEGFMVQNNPAPCGNYFYFGWGTYEPYRNYFARFDVSKINKSATASEPQPIAPEILWSSEYNYCLFGQDCGNKPKGDGGNRKPVAAGAVHYAHRGYCSGYSQGLEFYNR